MIYPGTCLSGYQLNWTYMYAQLFDNVHLKAVAMSLQELNIFIVKMSRKMLAFPLDIKENTSRVFKSYTLKGTLITLT